MNSADSLRKLPELRSNGTGNGALSVSLNGGLSNRNRSGTDAEVAVDDEMFDMEAVTRVSSVDTQSSMGQTLKHVKRSSSASSYNRSQDIAPTLPKIGKIGVCAMDSKARSKPCRQILNNLIENGEFETVIFGDKVILDESVENWPTCDFLICFFSSGFPLEKAIDYVNLRKPFLVNDLHLQKILWDRRLVLKLLDASNVRTPERVIISRDGGPKADAVVKQKLANHGVTLEYEPEIGFEMIDYDTMKLADGTILKKPFVEKPVNGEDHNVYIFYSKDAGGGGRRLFRKVGNKSSEYDPDLHMPRSDGSFIYETFMDTDNSEDVKAYTVGIGYCHAETRKSPVVDGIVRRNTYGKELRFVTKLSEEERRMAASISQQFEQTICGFDLLRVHGKSYVIDVNGFSFVKDNKDYYDSCARILRQMFIEEKNKSNRRSMLGMKTLQNSEEKQQKWVFKGVVCVVRHADRTPKQKFKYNFKSQLFIDLLQGHKMEVILREKEHLQHVLEVTEQAILDGAEDLVKLNHLKLALQKKMYLPGTKVQIKPTLAEDGNGIEKVQLIIKWGGEPTHSARYQAIDLGENMRKDLLLLNKDLLNNVTVYTSSERRVIASAKLFTNTFLELQDMNDGYIEVRKDLLDDSTAAKDLMDRVKKKLKPMLRQGIEPPPQFTWPQKIPEPYVVLKRVVELMQFHKKIMDYNFRYKNSDEFQPRWCCNEDPLLFKERWDKLFSEFLSVEKVDPSKISELYDTMKFDALHNRQFLEKIFEIDANMSDIELPCGEVIGWKPKAEVRSGSLTPFNAKEGHPIPNLSALGQALLHHQGHGNSTQSSHAPTPPTTASEKTGPFDKPSYNFLRELYYLAKILFDFICPQEYGIEDSEKLDIGLLTSLPLVKQILDDIESIKKSDVGQASFYFTKESHIYTLLNVLYGTGIPTRIERNALPELDYLTRIAFEVYESADDHTREKKYSIKLTISPGCNSQSPLDVQLDSKHCLSCIPRQALTRHLDSDEVISKLESQYCRVSMPKKFIPVNISEEE